MTTSRRNFFGMLAAAPLVPFAAAEATTETAHVVNLQIDARELTYRISEEFMRHMKPFIDAEAERLRMVDHGPFFSSTPGWKATGR